MISEKIPYQFISRNSEIGWNELLFGLKHQLISEKAAIDKAVERLCGNSPTSEEETLLAGASVKEPIIEFVERLAKAEISPSIESIKSKWLYLILSWLLENKDKIADPLAVVEEVYSDFDYLPEVAPFVRYMPMVGPDLGSIEENEKRLFRLWKDYVGRAADRWRKKT